MDSSKLKNLFIFLLLLVNSFLLILVMKNESEAKEAQNYRTQALLQVFAEHGISLSRDINLSQTPPMKVSLTRDLSKEHKRLTSLIGKCTTEDMGGNMYFYKSKNAQASFRGTGDFDIVIENNAFSAGNDPASTAKSLMKKMGYKSSIIETTTDNTSGSVKVTLSCTWENANIYNARVKFIFEKNQLIITGRRPLDVEYNTNPSDEYIDCITVLMNFLEYVRNTGEVCTEIQSIEAGYFLETAVSGECSLRPVWKIVADTGLYYIDVQTGKWERLENFTD